MRRNKRRGCFYVFIYLLAAPLASVGQEAANSHAIYVSSISWHTGVLLPANSLPDSLWPQGHGYADASYLEIGWGEADYYPSPGFNLWYGVKAVLWPTSSVLHVNPIYRQPEEYYSDTEVVRIEVNEEQLRRLTRFLLKEFELNENGKVIPAAEGLYADSYFYEGSSNYFFPKTSNVWAAKALKKAGFSISPIWYQNTGWLLNKAENFGELVVEEE